MKLNRRFAGMLLAGAMIAGMMALPAGATVDQTPSTPPPTTPGVQEGAIVYIEKVLNKDPNAYAPKVDIGFTVTPAEVSAGEVDHLDNVVYKGEDAPIGDVTPASFAPKADDISKDKVTADATFTINPNVFTKPGVFKYTVTENAVTYPGIDKDDSVKTLYVYVVNNEDNSAYVVDGTVLLNADETKSDGFVNTLTTRDFTVKKVIEGNAANLKGGWKFTVMVQGEEGDKYKLVLPNGTVEVLNEGDSKEITLRHEETFKVYGLSSDDTYTVTETEANSDGYTTTVDADGVDVESNNGTITDKLTENKDFTYTNTKDQVTPTGLLMDIAPYAAMLVLAAAAAFVFLRRRTNED